MQLPFPERPGAKRDLRSGVLYAIDAGDGNIYYGQVTAQRDVGFLRFRSTAAQAEVALEHELMSRFGVNWPSIGIAVRKGVWLNLGRFDLHPELQGDVTLVQWPVGTLRVSLWRGSHVIRETDVHDPDIQNLEVMSSYDAVAHVPSRIVAEYNRSPDEWKVVGSVSSMRRVKEDLAHRFPSHPWHSLPPGWVPTGHRV